MQTGGKTTGSICRVIQCLLLCLYLLFSSSCSSFVGLTLKNLNFDTIASSIVKISFLDANEKGIEHVGTGFIYTEQKLVITCVHVLPPNVEEVEIEMPASMSDTPSKVKARVLVRDEPSDIAILKIIDLEYRMDAFLEASDQGFYQGLEVWTFGYPKLIHGYEGSYCTSGVIAQGEPQMIEINNKEFTFALADLSVSTGNSGGPIVDRLGAVVGVVNGVKYYQATTGDAPVTITLFTPISKVDELIVAHDVGSML